jgi:ABC-2 type transport system ATP-binding protein
VTSVVSVADVSKTFRLYHERAYSLKERIVNRRRARYETFWALRDVSIEIGGGETAGLIGPNGSGKTTLLKLVAGIIRPTEGRIETHGRIASLLELGAGFHPDLTGRQNVYLNASILGLSKKETDRHFDAIVAFSELEKFIDMQVRHYSSGMYVRLGFAVAVHVDPQILIVDEVLSVGDEAFQRKCLDRIRTFQRDGRTIVFVTHAADTVREICNSAFFLWEGRLAAAGKPADVIREYRHQLHGEAHLEAAPFEERGDRRVRILRVRLADADGKERTAFRPGEDLHVIVDLEAPDPIEDPLVGIAIHDNQDGLVVGTNSDIAGLPLGTVHGKSRITFVCRSIPMRSGTFALTVGVTTRDNRTVYHWQEKAYPFRCEDATAGHGSIAVRVDATVERL